MKLQSINPHNPSVNSEDKTNTPGEVVDLVNDQDEIIGRSTKGEVNSNPNLIHREISVLIHDGKDRVLTQQRSSTKKTHPLFWIISVAGHVPSGMDPEAAAHMELKEELGFDTNLKFYEKVLLKYPNETHFCYSFLGRLPPNTRVTIDPNESQQYKFIDSKKLEEMLQSGEKIEDYSLSDFRRFFTGEFNKFIQPK